MRPDDDLKLGKIVKKHGFRQDMAIGRGLITVEWYATVGELIDGLMKNAFAGVDYSLSKVAGSSVGLFLLHVWPFAALFLTSGTTRALNAVCVAADRADLLDRERHARGVCAGFSRGRAPVHLHHVALGADGGAERDDHLERHGLSAIGHAREPRIASKPCERVYNGSYGRRLMTISRRQAMRVSGTTLAGLSMGLRPEQLLAQAPAQTPAPVPDTLVDSTLGTSRRFRCCRTALRLSTPRARPERLPSLTCGGTRMRRLR